MSFPTIIPATVPNLEIGKEEPDSPLGNSSTPPEPLPETVPDGTPDNDRPADGSDHDSDEPASGR